MTSRAAERAGLAFVLLLELVAFAWFVAAKRIPAGADGFQYLALQYTFLNNAAATGEVPQWLPLMTHGTVANWWYFVQAGLAQSVYGVMGTALQGVNGLFLFNVGMFIDRLVLLAGTWMLCGLLFRTTSARVFVTITTLATSLWVTQPWFAFHFYYALPLVLYLGHRFLDTGRWRYFVLAANLAELQALGNLPYFPPVTALVLFLYFVGVVVADPAPIRHQLSRFPLSWRGLGALLTLVLPGIALVRLVSDGTGEIVNYNVGRGQDLSTTLEGFLAYGSNTDSGKWLELLTGFSPALDFNLFVGYLALPCLVAALLAPTRRSVPWLVLAVVLGALNSASVGATVLYYAWPGMSHFRHLALVAPLVRVCLVLLSGFGFEALLFPTTSRRRLRVLLAVSGPALLALAIALTATAVDGDSPALLARMICQQAFEVVESGLPRIQLSPAYLTWRMQLSALACCVTGLALMVLYMGTTRRPTRGAWAVASRVAPAFLLAWHVLVLSGYHVAEMAHRTIVLAPGQEKVFDFVHVPFQARREVRLARSERTDLVAGLTLPIRLNWSTQSFVFQDELGSRMFRVDHWLKPLDELVRTWTGQDIDDLTKLPRGLVPFRGFFFAAQGEAALGISGVLEDKIQFFGGAERLPDDRAVSSRMQQADFDGSVLLLSPRVSERAPPAPAVAGAGRLRLAYKVVDFSANRIAIALNAPGPGAWLMYADTWHPSWTATVNGRAVPVERADLAYKAVQLDAGPNLVEFRFDIPWFRVIYFCVGVNSLLWVGGVALLLTRALGAGASKEARPWRLRE